MIQKYATRIYFNLFQTFQVISKTNSLVWNLNVKKIDTLFRNRQVKFNFN